MKTLRIPHTALDATRIAYGCMMIGGKWDTSPLTAEARTSADAAIRAALDAGINFFDHADIYCCGKSEEVFATALKDSPGLRDRLILQSKCGIRDNRYDFSYEHITKSVDGILQRLGTDRIDILLLHRPDPLVEPAEVARAFDELHAAGKVLNFGVSNHTVGQMERLRRHLRQPIVANQLQFSLAQPALVTEGFLANQKGTESALATGILDYCQLHDILVQAWAPLAGGRLLQPDPATPDATTPVAALITKLAGQYDVSAEAILLAWILRHPAGIQPVIGTTKPERIRGSAKADGITLTREEWYALLTTARGKRMP